MLHDACAVAAASLRLQPTAKAYHRCASALALLGEFEVADSLLCAAAEHSGEGFVKQQVMQCAHLRCDITNVKQLVTARYPMNAFISMMFGDSSSGGMMSDWVAEDKIEALLIEGCGRGVQTSCGIDVGEVLIVQRPRASALEESSKTLLTSTNSSTRLLDDASKVKLKANSHRLRMLTFVWHLPYIF